MIVMDRATTVLYSDPVFAPIDRDLQLERVAGGNETEVYRTDDSQYVVKLKSDLGAERGDALAAAHQMRAVAEQFAACLGPEHSIPSYYLLACDSAGRVQVLVIQPFLHAARPLYSVDYRALSSSERAQVATQLREIIRRTLSFYRETGSMPDLYGRSSADAAERQRLNAPSMLPWRLWNFLVQRNLLRSHNLLLVQGSAPRVVLVDYDFVRRGPFYKRVYYAVRWFLFWRDHLLIHRMQAGHATPR
jgi:hypothetical protein